MDTCNYLYVLILVSWWGSLILWGVVIGSIIVAAIVGGGCRFAWNAFTKPLFRSENRIARIFRKYHLLALPSVISYVGLPIAIILSATYLLRTYGIVKEAENVVRVGRHGGEKASLGDIALRWIECGNQSCWMMDSEVTAQIWARVMPDFGKFEKIDDDFPVVVESKYCLDRFVREMNRKYHLWGWSWSLPTENQWLSAWKAGAERTSRDLKLNTGWLMENSKGTVHPCKSKDPNPWGLYDMIGNVGEYCKEEFCIAGWDWRTSVDEEDPSVLAESYEDDDSIWVLRDEGLSPVGGIRLCLNPNALAYRNSGKWLWWEHSPQMIAFSNFVLMYGVAYLLFHLFVTWVGRRVRDSKLRKVLHGLSVFAEWEILLSPTWKKQWKRKLAALAQMSCKGILQWCVGLFVVSPATILITDLPDWTFAVPEAFLVIIASVTLLPVFLSSLGLWGLLRSLWKNAESKTPLEKLREGYRYLIVPIMCVIVYGTCSDAYDEISSYKAATVNRSAVVSARQIKDEALEVEDIDWCDSEEVVKYAILKLLHQVKLDAVPGTIKIGSEYRNRGAGRSRGYVGPYRRDVNLRIRNYGVIVDTIIEVSYYRQNGHDVRIQSAYAKEGVRQLPNLNGYIGQAIFEVIKSEVNTTAERNSLR